MNLDEKIEWCEENGICLRCRKRPREFNRRSCNTCYQQNMEYNRKRGYPYNTERVGKHFGLRKYKRDEFGGLLLQCTKCNDYKNEIDFGIQKDCRFERKTICIKCDSHWKKYNEQQKTNRPQRTRIYKMPMSWKIKNAIVFSKKPTLVAALGK